MKKYLITIICLILAIISFVTYKNITKKPIENTKITLAEVTHSIFYAPLYVAIENDYFKDKNIDIELILTPGADNVSAAVLSGDAQIGLSGSEATIYVYNGGEKDYLKTFAQLTQKDGSFIVSREKIDNFKIEDLKGKYIIGGRIGGMPEMTLEWVLKENNIDPKNDLTIDTSITFANMASAFIGGTGDFVALFEPLATTVEQQGYGYKVASLGSLGGIVPYTAFNAKTSYIENNKDLIKDFTKIIQKGLDFVHNNDSKTIADIIKNQFPDTDIESIISSVESYKQDNAWPKNTTFTKESFDHLQEIVVEAGILEKDKTVSYNDLVYGQ